jgi:hypothetical protein
MNAGLGRHFSAFGRDLRKRLRKIRTLSGQSCSGPQKIDPNGEFSLFIESDFEAPDICMAFQLLEACAEEDCGSKDSKKIEGQGKRRQKAFTKDKSQGELSQYPLFSWYPRIVPRICLSPCYSCLIFTDRGEEQAELRPSGSLASHTDGDFLTLDLESIT